MALFRRADGVDALDARENLEWKAGRIAGAVHIPLLQLATREHELPRGTTIVTVCRSSLAARGRRQAGFQVRNLDVGMKAWARAGLPLEPPGVKPLRVEELGG